MKELCIDLNCDLGESYGRFTVGDDAAIFPFLSSCNIACGYHGGDPKTMEETIDHAIKHEVAIGAHPSYPDLMGFGRNSMSLPYDELESMIKYQISALKGLVESKGGHLRHVKPHGALYNDAVSDSAICSTICKAVAAIDQDLAIMGLAGSRTVEAAAQAYHLRFIPEAFADRRYLSDGSLVSRKESNAVIHNAEEAAIQVMSIVKRQAITSVAGAKVALTAQTVCIHGDHPYALQIARKVRQVLEVEGISIKSSAL